MKHKWKKYMQFVLTICGISILAVACTGCLAAAKYRDMTCNLECCEEQEFNDKSLNSKEAIWKGEYLGIKKYSKNRDQLAYHYQFSGLLEGEERTLHFILPIHEYYGAYAIEADRIESPSAQPAWLLLTEDHSPEEINEKAKEIQAQIPLVTNPNILYINLRLNPDGYDDFFITMNPDMVDKWDNSRTGNEWRGGFRVSWKVRSRIMNALRYAGAHAVALMYVPVDVALVVTSPVWGPLLIYGLANARW